MKRNGYSGVSVGYRVREGEEEGCERVMLTRKKIFKRQRPVCHVSMFITVWYVCRPHKWCMREETPSPSPPTHTHTNPYREIELIIYLRMDPDVMSSWCYNIFIIQYKTKSGRGVELVVCIFREKGQERERERELGVWGLLSGLLACSVDSLFSCAYFNAPDANRSWQLWANDKFSFISLIKRMW